MVRFSWYGRHSEASLPGISAAVFVPKHAAAARPWQQHGSSMRGMAWHGMAGHVVTWDHWYSRTDSFVPMVGIVGVLEQGVNVGVDVVDKVVARVPSHELAVRTNEELLEIPSDVTASNWGPKHALVALGVQSGTSTGHIY